MAVIAINRRSIQKLVAMTTRKLIKVQFNYILTISLFTQKVNSMTQKPPFLAVFADVLSTMILWIGQSLSPDRAQVFRI